MTWDGELQRICIRTQSTIREALEAIDRGAASIALVTDDDSALLGTVTDGDVRRALLAGAGLDDSVERAMHTTPHVAPEGTARAKVLDMMRTLHITELPVVDEDGRLVGLQTMTDIVGRPELSNIAVIMAGGKGTRLGALTKDVPKPLMRVADRPIIEWIILGLVESGITRIYVSVSHMADQIMDYLGDGAALGCSIKYLYEDPAKPLNTAGALGLLAHEVPDISQPVIVTNADLMARYSAQELIEFHAKNKAALTVAARPYTHQVPFGVLELDETRGVKAVVEKPSVEFEISTGIYAVSPEAVAMVPYGEPFSMPELITACLEQDKRIAAWPIESDWIDVGTPKDLAAAKGQ